MLSASLAEYNFLKVSISSEYVVDMVFKLKFQKCKGIKKRFPILQLETAFSIKTKFLVVVSVTSTVMTVSIITFFRS